MSLVCNGYGDSFLGESGRNVKFSLLLLLFLLLLLLLLLLLEALQLQRRFGLLDEFLLLSPISDVALPVCYFEVESIDCANIFNSVFISLFFRA